MSTLSEEEELLAAELAFGLIAAETIPDLGARVARNPAFAAAYARWQDRAASLFTDVGETPSSAVWSGIEVRLPANNGALRGRESARGWRVAAFAASAAAMLLAVVLVERPTRTMVANPSVPVVAQPPLVAILSSGEKSVVAVSFDRVSGRLTSTPNALQIGNHAAQLWVIPADGKPRSLGLIATRAPGWSKAPAPAAAAILPGVTLAISVEPSGGSPTGRPTGPIILKGKVSAI